MKWSETGWSNLDLDSISIRSEPGQEASTQGCGSLNRKICMFVQGILSCWSSIIICAQSVRLLPVATTLSTSRDISRV